MSKQLSLKQHHSYQPIFIDRECGTEKVTLLKAPSIESEAMWKLQCFTNVYDRLRPKLDTYSADTLTAIFAEHFPLSTQAAEQEARTVVQKFRETFGIVKFLEPTSFVDTKGNDKSAEMFKKERPPNVCHLGVHAAIPMKIFSPAYTSEVFELDYYLALPQSFGPHMPMIRNEGDRVSQKANSASLLGSAAALDSNFFSTSSQHLLNPQKDLSYSIILSKRKTL